LTSVSLPGGGVVSFQYDPFGRRIRKISVSGTSVYVYDGDNQIEELNSSGGVVARYAQGLGIDEPLALYRSGKKYYYHADGLGSIVALSDNHGTPKGSYTYDAFGNDSPPSPPPPPSSVTNPFRYTGRELDSETGLYYYRARYYDPSVGRFLSEDPSSSCADTNFYRYVFNDPNILMDPLGLQAGNANTWTYGEIGSWAWLPSPGYPAPAGLGDAKASIDAACTLNGGGCNAKDGSGATDPISRAAWNNILNANGKDLSGGGNFMCVGGEGCWFVHGCYECLNGKKTFVERPKRLQPSGTVKVGAHTLFFYEDSLQGWCNEADRKSQCKCKK
jgi:RHS repeat-associated protein